MALSVIEYVMRLFVAVNFSDDVKSRIIKIQEELRAQASKGSFSRPENLHLTLAFLGETPKEKLEILFGIMEEIQCGQEHVLSPFDIVFNHSGCFTHSHKELWWIGADSDGVPLLKAIHEQLLGRLEAAGFSVDKRPFNAHVTLGREIRHTRPIVLDCPGITVRVERVSLMKSEHLRGVLTYTELFKRQLELRTNE